MSDHPKQIRLTESDKEAWNKIAKHMERLLFRPPTDSEILRYCIYYRVARIINEEPA